MNCRNLGGSSDSKHQHSSSPFPCLLRSKIFKGGKAHKPAKLVDKASCEIRVIYYSILTVSKLGPFPSITTPVTACTTLIRFLLQVVPRSSNKTISLLLIKGTRDVSNVVSFRTLKWCDGVDSTSESTCKILYE